MLLQSDFLHVLRECCRDEAAFHHLQQLFPWLQEQATVKANYYKALLDAIPDRVFRLNRAGFYLDFQGNLEDGQQGIQSHWVVGKHMTDFLPPEVVDCCQAAIDRTLETQTLQVCEYEMVSPWQPEAEIHSYEARLVPCGPGEVLAIVRDTTVHRMATTLLQVRESQYRQIFESTWDGLLINDPETGIVVEANPACCQMHGYTREEFIGLHPRQFIHPDHYGLFEEYVVTVKAGQPFRCRAMDLRKDGSPFPIEVTGTQVIYQGTCHLLAVIRDVTIQVEMEAALRTSEAQHRALLDAIPDLMFRIQRDGTYLDVRADSLVTLALPPEQLIGQRVADVLPPHLAQQRMAMIERALATEQLQSFEYQLPVGNQPRDWEARVVVSGRDEVLVMVRDITSRKQAQIQLQAAAERDRLLGQIALKIRCSLNLDEILTTTVDEVRQSLKADRVFIGQIDANYRGRIAAESADPRWGSILTWIIDDSHLQEIRMLYQQGCSRVVDDTSQIDPNSSLNAYFRRCHIQASLGVPIFLGDEFFGTLVVNQCSSPRHWLPHEIDLLEQLATQVAIAIQQANLYHQVRELNASLERQVEERTAELQQKMRELQDLNQLKDDFLHAVSHDLRTPVMGQGLVLKNLLRKPGESVTVSKALLERMLQSNDRQLQMISSLLEAHSSQTQGVMLDYQSVLFSELVQSVVQELEPLVDENQATLVSQTPIDLPPIMADPVQLQRVLENLITNALKHNPPPLTITLVVGVTSEEMIRCSIQDNGLGLDQQECEQLFDRYARGSRARRSTGLGLGLYLCRQIITAHGGQIGVISTPGTGANFWFTLPMATGT